MTKHTLTIALICFLTAALVGPIAADPAYIYAMHDPGGEQNMADMGTKGWIVFTVGIGHNPSDYSGTDYSSYTNAGYGVIVRLNNGYGSDGTLPYQSQYANFAQRCANYVANSPGCHIWIIGNETNLPREWPGNINGSETTGEPITVTRYADCYSRCYNAIKGLSGHSSDQVIPSPVGTWAPPYPNQGIEPFDDYWVNELNACSGKVDGIAVHAYTHGTDPSLVFSEALMGYPYEDIHYNFRVYKDLMNRVPTAMRSVPAYITETDENGAWADTNSGWVRNVYAEINSWNQTSGTQKIRCVALFRWLHAGENDLYYICDRWGVIQDWRDAMTYRYVWNTGVVQNDANSGTDAGGTFSTALAISPGSYTGYLEKNVDDNDYYKFTVNSGQTISITMTPPSSADFDIYLYNPAGTQKALSENGTGQTDTINFTADSTGDWRLRVYAYSGSGNYSFSVSVTGGAPGGTNLLPNAPIYLECGHNNSDQRARYMRDGSLSTKWCCLHNGISTAGDHWVAFDLGGTATVTGYVVKHASMGGEATYLNTKTFYIESASSLMGPWTTEFYVDNATTVASNTLTYGTAKALRYIRLRVTRPNPSADWAVRIPEFEVWGTAGTAASIKIEAENYDRFYGAVDGAQYHDSDSGNSGGQYRSQGVDIETCSEGTYNVGWIYSGEWLLYPWKATGTTYTPAIRYAGTSAGTCHIEVDGVNKTGSISLPATGGWQTWTTKNVSAFTVTAGEHDIKLVMDSTGFNVDYFTLTPGSGGGWTPISEAFESMPSWSSSYDASWGSAATWSIASGGQSGNFLQASRSSQGSSAKVKVYTVPANSNISLSIYCKCPSYSGTYWMETAYKLGNYAASDFDQNGSTWTMVKKFANDGTNGNGNVWTQYSTSISTGAATQISVGVKLGSSGGGGPTVGWDTMAIQ